MEGIETMKNIKAGVSQKAKTKEMSQRRDDERRALLRSETCAKTLSLALRDYQNELTGM